MNETNSTRRNPWPYAITAWLILFAGGLAAWIVVAVRNDVQLVREDYYEHEMLFQQQIDRTARAQQTGNVTLDYDAAAHAITIHLPAAHAQQSAKGRIHLYRPSDATLDRQVQLALNIDGTQRLDTRGLRPGLWKVRLEWSVNGEEFYFDRPIIVSERKS